MEYLIYIPAVVAGLAFAYWAVTLRQVVPTNMVHTVQSAKKTTSYGTKQAGGNVYYKWPSWIPIIGVTVIELPVSNFDLTLREYKAYDIDRVPFTVDVTAFFRIEDTNEAAQRVETHKELYEQLEYVVQGAVRTILASYKIDQIMLERSTFGEAFTKEVSEGLKQWGVTAVKNMELMDIQDADGSHVISNIMAKKKSFIEMESRKEVANNLKEAETAEIEAKQIVDIRGQEALQAVGERAAEKDKQVGIANEKAKQQIKEQERATKEKEMAVIQVAEVKNQEIIKEKAVVKAEEEKQTAVIRAEGQKAQTVLDAEAKKEQTVLVADGDLAAKLKEAEGIEAEGKARGEAETAIQMAPVNAQIALAQEIGSNESYQNYLQTIEAIGAQKTIGVEQAKALVAADVKVIANTGNTPDGVKSVMDLFTSKGGTQIAGMAEAMNNSDIGRAMLNALGVNTPIANDPVETEAEERATGTTGRRKKDTTVDKASSAITKQSKGDWNPAEK